MKNFTHVFVLCFLALNGFAQKDFNLEMVANVPVNEEGNDIWGYVDAEGTEYAIMGSQTKTTIWSLEDPANPIERATIPGPPGVWRDIKSFEDHLYVTSDQGAEGLLIIDMSLAPDTITSLYWKPTFEINDFLFPLTKCHNLYIDTEQGFCYLAGCEVSQQGVLILDLNQDKKEPVLVGVMDDNYSHDVFVQDDLMYTSDIFVGSFNVYDVSDKSNPVFINGAGTSRQFTHNAWASHDGNYLFTTDERENAWVDAFDISDLNDIQFLDRYQPLATQGTDVIPHNTHYLNGFLITSWYTDGVVIVDATKPDNLIKVGSYDTELEITKGYEGCWGAYPFLPSGIVLASDRNHGLFVLQPQNSDGEVGYQRACYLEGLITDAKTGETITNANVQIISEDLNEASSRIGGIYKTGQATPGEFEVEYSHPNYDTLTLTVTLERGKVTIVDAQLGTAEITGTVTDTDGNPIIDAKVVVDNVGEGFKTFASTDVDGNWCAGVRSNLNDYEISAAKWGFKGITQSYNSESGATLDLILEEGYEDDFFVDLGWTATGNASSGFWEIAVPEFIFGSGQTTQTSADIGSDIGNTYYITGASGTNQGVNDIDNGAVILTSPAMDFTGVDSIDFSYHIWFVNVGGQDGPPNDFVTVSVTNGIETIELTRIDENDDKWSSLIETSISKDQMEFNDQIRIIVHAEDSDPGHIVEAGFDVFKATGTTITSVVDILDLGLSVYPNPSNGMITLTTESAWEGEKQITIFNNIGMMVLQQELTDPKMTINIDQFASGLYSIQIIGKNKVSETIKFSKI